MPRWYNILASVLFVGAVSIPGIGTFVDLEAMVLARMGIVRSKDWDQRAKAEPLRMPENYRGWLAFPDECSRYVDDHFGFRYSLVRSNRRIYRDVFRDSDARNMLLGKDGWHFLRGMNSVIEYTEHRFPLSSGELRMISSAFEEISDSLSQAGIPFLIVVAPNKHSIYSEMLPDYISPADATRLDQIQNAPSVAGLIPFDLRKELAAEKHQGQLYERTGTHWTDLGAWLAFCRVMSQVKQLLPDHDVSLPSVTFTESRQGPFEFGHTTELLPELHYAEKQTVRSLKREILAAAAEDMTDFQKRHRPFRLEGLGTGHAVIFRDSFCSRMVPLLATQFQTIDFYWQTQVDLDVVQTVCPDLVILEFAERHLMHPDRFCPVK